ncbi:hypothetical protein V6N11_035274 [Hibiscus sabdariffa]|uniref:Uncharacterized protein n=1 Tax=Hibiscus sabdariffa TaxID=183260 RepID=A0ABR2R006_9ROSI
MHEHVNSILAHDSASSTRLPQNLEGSSSSNENCHMQAIVCAPMNSTLARESVPSPSLSQNVALCPTNIACGNDVAQGSADDENDVNHTSGSAGQHIAVN